MAILENRHNLNIPCIELVCDYFNICLAIIRKGWIIKKTLECVPSCLFEGVCLVLGNDLAGGQVFPTPIVVSEGNGSDANVFNVLYTWVNLHLFFLPFCEMPRKILLVGGVTSIGTNIYYYLLLSLKWFHCCLQKCGWMPVFVFALFLSFSPPQGKSPPPVARLWERAWD